MRPSVSADETLVFELTVNDGIDEVVVLIADVGQVNQAPTES